jgi:hypothetical protein
MGKETKCFTILKGTLPNKSQQFSDLSVSLHNMSLRLHNSRERRSVRVNILTPLSPRIADPRHFTADPEPFFHFHTDQDPAFHFTADADSNPAPLQSDGICDHWSILDPPGPHFEPPVLHCERPLIFMALFLASTLLNFEFNADPDPAFHFNADPDPASKNNADPNPQPCCLPLKSLPVASSL